jgi:histidinol dehydrogenase
MRIVETTDREAIRQLASRDQARDPVVEEQAAQIVDDVRARGDAALREWTARLDERIGAPGRGTGGRERESVVAPIAPAVLKRGWAQTPPPVRRALRLAVRQIERVAERQTPRPFRLTPTPGVVIEQHVQPLGRVGCYVPGGRYPLPSTLLMTVVPARAAGVRSTIVVCPRPAPVVLAAALEAGATSVFAIGGAQAIAALAYGTESIPRVEKIVGPGNAWVTAAKAYVSRDCPIDLHAGPSEIVVYANRGPAAWIAADLIAQAEHDPAARALFVTTSRDLAIEVAGEVQRQMPAAGPASESIARNGAILVAATEREAIAVVNQLAPEHLVVDEEARVGAFTAAGTIFVGPWSVQAAGDYATGSNHVLPTGGAARVRGGLSAADFVRVFNVQRLTKGGIAAIGPAVVALAEAEGLTAHAASVRLRLAPRRTARRRLSR